MRRGSLHFWSEPRKQGTPVSLVDTGEYQKIWLSCKMRYNFGCGRKYHLKFFGDLEYLIQRRERKAPLFDAQSASFTFLKSADGNERKKSGKCNFTWNSSLQLRGFFYSLNILFYGRSSDTVIHCSYTQKHVADFSIDHDLSLTV